MVLVSPPPPLVFTIGILSFIPIPSPRNDFSSTESLTLIKIWSQKDIMAWLVLNSWVPARWERPIQTHTHARTVTQQCRHPSQVQGVEFHRSRPSGSSCLTLAIFIDGSQYQPIPVSQKNQNFKSESESETRTRKLRHSKIPVTRHRNTSGPYGTSASLLQSSDV